MTKVKEWKNCLIALVPSGKLTVVLQAPDELISEMDDCFIDDHVLTQEAIDSLPKEVGVYKATIEEWMEHYEDPDWELRLSEMEVRL